MSGNEAPEGVRIERADGDRDGLAMWAVIPEGDYAARLGDQLRADVTPPRAYLGLRVPIPPGFEKPANGGSRYCWWLSFVDPAKPAGERFLGVAIVEAPTIEDALTRSHLLGANPGGEVAAVPMRAGAVGPEWQDRLLTREEAENLPEPG